MFVRQVLNEDLGCASYVLADGGEAAVVDPQWDIDPYLRIAEDHDLRIARIFETHNHADHLSGRGRLSAATGATIHISCDAGVDYEHDALSDGDRRELGGVRITALAAPGHRPEHMA
jgi:hydroxyacylglutathione hydrolase